MFPYLISISILSQITATKPQRLQKMYAQILNNDCIPLTAIPFVQQEAFVKDYLLRNRYVDIDLIRSSSRKLLEGSFIPSAGLDTIFLPFFALPTLWKMVV